MNNIQLSKRLTAVASLVEGGGRVADIGTDHGFVPIYLIENKKAGHVVAMDVNEGPLERAKAHVAEHGMEGDIELRLSDGLSALNKNEADTMICAGMGGLLMMRIIKEGRPGDKGIGRMILQPQSDLFLFRVFLRENNLIIEKECEIFEEGKYYTAMRVFSNPDLCDPAFNSDEKMKGRDAYPPAVKMLMEYSGCDEVRAINICHRFGPYLIAEKNEILYKYLSHEREICDRILLKLSEDEHADRMRDIMNKKNDISTVMELYK